MILKKKNQERAQRGGKAFGAGSSRKDGIAKGAINIFTPMAEASVCSALALFICTQFHSDNYHSTIYSPECLGWYHESGAEVVGVGMFSRLHRSVGVSGLIGVDRILSFKIVHKLQSLTKYVSANCMVPSLCCA